MKRDAIVLFVSRKETLDQGRFFNRLFHDVFQFLGSLLHTVAFDWGADSFEVIFFGLVVHLNIAIVNAYLIWRNCLGLLNLLQDVSFLVG